MAIEQKVQKSLLDDDALYCEEEEEKWGDVDQEEDSGITSKGFDGPDLALFPQLLLEQDLFWDDEQLQSLFCKEKEAKTRVNEVGFSARKEAVEWILRINAHYGFSALTAILAVNYLDRFLCSLSFQKDKPWMVQLAAVTCLSLAAKVEETHVPLLLDLQMEGTEYVFEAKNIQRMELLVLSALKWRMNPVTALSFIDHIIRRLGLKCYVHWEFLRRCENLLLSVISDSRSATHLPSVLATATMLHVIHRVDPDNGIAYENQLLDVLQISKEEVDDCYNLLSDIQSNSCAHSGNNKKRAMDPILNTSESWSSCVSCSPVFKKRKVQEQQMRLSSLSRVFVDGVLSPH